jgi:hypothetical protein
MSSQQSESDLRALLRRAWEVASDLHGARLAKDSEDEYGDHVDLYDHIMDFEERFPFAEIKAALETPPETGERQK